MNKIEEILEIQNLAIPIEYLKGAVIMGKNCKNDYKKILDAIKEFGKICFEAGRNTPKTYIEAYYRGNVNSYETYENFLKEIEDEAGN